MLRVFLTFTMLLLLGDSALAGVFYKSARRAGFRASAALRNVRPTRLRDGLQRSSEELIGAVEEIGQCEVNICFAFEGSADVSSETYQLQNQFSSLTSAIISTDNVAKFSAIQYSTTTSPIVSPTVDFYDFLDKVRASTPVGDDLINMSAALGSCGAQVREDETKKGVIIVIGSGRSNIGFDPDSVADVVLESTSIIAVSTSGNRKLFEGSLGVREQDVSVVGSVLDIGIALRNIIPNVCGSSEL